MYEPSIGPDYGHITESEVKRIVKDTLLEILNQHASTEDITRLTNRVHEEMREREKMYRLYKEADDDRKKLAKAIETQQTTISLLTEKLQGLENTQEGGNRDE